MQNTIYQRIVADNLALLFQKAAERFEGLPAFATRISALNWKPVTYRELYNQGIDLATGLIELGVEARDHVGLFGDNRYEWILSDCAVQLCGAADVPRGRDVSEKELEYIINHAGMRITFVETEALARKVLAIKEKTPALQEIIVLDHKAPDIDGVRRLQEVYELGSTLRGRGDKRVEERIEGIKPDDLFTLIYTSGTTGTPKGVMLTHANIISQTRCLPGRYNANDRILSVLPIWHVFERVVEMYTISFGGCTYYSSIATLGDDMKNVEPTFMASAPRLWEKVHERILNGVRASHPVRQVLFHIAYFLARQYKVSVYFLTNKDLRMTAPVWWKRWLLKPFHAARYLLVLPWYGFFNAAVLERIRLTAGGSLQATISGGGALPNYIDKFFNFVDIPVLEGYGLTETSPVISVRPKTDLVVGTVGPPIAETEVRIVCPHTETLLYPDPNCPYGGKGKRGEIQVRGPQVMKGYYKETELTQSVMQDGWLRTGDLGIVTFNNCLKIVGRSKATIVLISGENVEPEPLEMRLNQSPYIEQCMVTGQDQKFLGVLIVPDLLAFQKKGIKARNLDELLQLPEVGATIRREIKRLISVSGGYKRYEVITEFSLLTARFEVGQELTNLHKIKRHVVSEKYNSVINDLFKNVKIHTKVSL
jgi:long-chain acyl-CoA synthetase